MNSSLFLFTKLDHSVNWTKYGHMEADNNKASLVIHLRKETTTIKTKRGNVEEGNRVMELEDGGDQKIQSHT